MAPLTVQLLQIGTLPSMAPELLGDAPPPLQFVDRTDCWAVGVLAFQLLTGVMPWAHPVKSCLQQLLLEAAVPFQVLGGWQASAKQPKTLGTGSTVGCRALLCRERLGMQHLLWVCRLECLPLYS